MLATLVVLILRLANFGFGIILLLGLHANQHYILPAYLYELPYLIVPFFSFFPRLLV